MLPKVLGVPTEVVYLGTVVALPVMNFTISRQGVFHPTRTVEEPVVPPPEPQPEAERPVGTRG